MGPGPPHSLEGPSAGMRDRSGVRCAQGCGHGNGPGVAHRGPTMPAASVATGWLTPRLEAPVPVLPIFPSPGARESYFADWTVRRCGFHISRSSSPSTPLAADYSTSSDPVRVVLLTVRRRAPGHLRFAGVVAHGGPRLSRQSRDFLPAGNLASPLLVGAAGSSPVHLRPLPFPATWCPRVVNS